MTGEPGPGPAETGQEVLLAEVPVLGQHSVDTGRDMADGFDKPVPSLPAGTIRIMTDHAVGDQHHIE